MLWILENITEDFYDDGKPYIYDRVNAIIVRAPSEARARALCVGSRCNDGKVIDWEDPEQATCELLEEDGEEEIIAIDETPG